MEDEDYYSRIGIKYDFEGPTRLSYRLIMFYMIGITIIFLDYFNYFIVSLELQNASLHLLTTLILLDSDVDYYYLYFRLLEYDLCQRFLTKRKIVGDGDWKEIILKNLDQKCSFMQHFCS